MKKHSISFVVLSILLMSVVSVSSAETVFHQFYQQQNEAYARYRAALFQTNKNEQESSLKAVSLFLQLWDVIIQQYADAPPEIFAADPEWKTTLENIATIAAKGKVGIEAGALAEAHETLELIRDELTDLRQRNHVIVFSDHINTYHEVMEHLLEAGYTADNINDTALNAIREQLGVLEFLSTRIHENAPQEYRQNETYQQLEQGLFASIQALRDAVDKKSPEEIATAIQNLKVPYAKLFVNFG